MRCLQPPADFDHGCAVTECVQAVPWWEVFVVPFAAGPFIGSFIAGWKGAVVLTLLGWAIGFGINTCWQY